MRKVTGMTEERSTLDRAECIVNCDLSTIAIEHLTSISATGISAHRLLQPDLRFGPRGQSATQYDSTINSGVTMALLTCDKLIVADVVLNLTGAPSVPYNRRSICEHYRPHLVPARREVSWSSSHEKRYLDYNNNLKWHHECTT